MTTYTRIDKSCPAPVVEYLFKQLVQEVIKTPQKHLEFEDRNSILSVWNNYLECSNLSNDIIASEYNTLILCYMSAIKDKERSEVQGGRRNTLLTPLWRIIGYFVYEVAKTTKNPRLLKTIFKDFNNKTVNQDDRHFVFMMLSKNSYTPKNILKKLFWVCNTEKRFINIGFNLVENGNLRMSFKKILVTKYKCLQKHIKLSEFHTKYDAIMTNFYAF
jgi:hypothetical protein